MIHLSHQQSASSSGMNQDQQAIYISGYSQLLPNYIVDMTFPDYFTITMQISECETCTSAYIIGGPDMRIALNYSVYALQCNQTWEINKICGTWLEIHKPFNKEIIYDQQIKGKGSQVIYMLTKGLQSGRYEIWIVVRSRIGSIIQYVKSFFITIVT